MKDLGIILFIALKHLRVRLRQSVSALLSVAMGAMILVVTLAMMEGLLEEFKDKLLEASPAVIVEPERVVGVEDLLGEPGLVNLERGSPPRAREDIPGYEGLARTMLSVEGVMEVAPRACTAAIAYHGTRSERTLVCGIDAKAEKRVTSLWRWMTAGKMEDLAETSGGIILGKILARRISARVGSRVRLTSPAGEAADFRVIGIFASGITKIDESQSYVRLGEGRELAGFGAGSVTQVGIEVENLGMSSRIAREIGQKSGMFAQNWEEANESAIGAFRMMGVATYLLVIFTAVVGGFGIFNVMITIVMEKVRDIAILRSIGYTGAQVLKIFFMEAMLLGSGGGALGCGAGWFISKWIESLPFHSTEASSLQRDQFTMLTEPRFFLMAFLISLGISLIAGIGPARKAARVDPVDVLRGER